MFGAGGQGVYPLPPAFLASTALAAKLRVTSRQDWLQRYKHKGQTGRRKKGKKDDRDRR